MKTVTYDSIMSTAGDRLSNAVDTSRITINDVFASTLSLISIKEMFLEDFPLLHVRSPRVLHAPLAVISMYM